MFNLFSKPKRDGQSESDAMTAHEASLYRAIASCQATIEFEPDGTIRTANDLFLQTVGYSLSEIEGKHHRMFVTEAYAQSSEYAHFWSDLAAGKVYSGEFKRVGRSKKEVWIQASYNPIRDPDGNVTGVIKCALDITAQKKAREDRMNRSHAVIEFAPDGTILKANETFQRTMGYNLSEVVGQHHRMFVDRDYAHTHLYEKFWDDLRAGEFQQGEFERVKKGGGEIWLQATYSPVVDANGKVTKIVKLASDVTDSHKSKSDAEVTSQAIAAGLMELSSAASEISSNVASSSMLADAVRDKTEAAARTVESLRDASEKVGEVMNVIGSLAEQTNLLALNATIESARAGELGKGFAVVASEVKDLARQTKDATEKIEVEITAIQDVVGNVVAVVGEIQGELNKVSDNTTTVAAAVEEQTSVITDLSMEAERLAR